MTRLFYTKLSPGSPCWQMTRRGLLPTSHAAAPPLGLEPFTAVTVRYSRNPQFSPHGQLLVFAKTIQKRLSYLFALELKSSVQPLFAISTNQRQVFLLRWSPGKVSILQMAPQKQYCLFPVENSSILANRGY